VERELKLFKDMMAFLMKIDAARRLAMHSGLKRILEPTSLVVLAGNA
jgi:hypothetical protein